jgi:hypothetical protein
MAVGNFQLLQNNIIIDGFGLIYFKLYNTTLSTTYFWKMKSQKYPSALFYD